MEEWTIRRAVLSDAEALRACIDAAYAQYADRISDMPPVLVNCAEEIAKYLVWVAESKAAGGAERKILGGVVLIPSDGFMLLANVAVHPDAAGAGIGRRLMMLGEEESVRHGFAEMRLNTHVEMPENIQLYARNGWSEISRKANAVSMKKSLPKA